MCPHIHVFGLELPTFGLMMLCGMVAAFVLLNFSRRNTDMTEDDLLTGALWAIVCGLVGSKLLYWIVEFDQVVADPAFLLQTLTAGFVFYGALIGGALGLLVYTHKRRQNLFLYLDLFVPSFAIAQAFGRIGCFCAGCCYGAPSNSCIAVTYPSGVGSAAPAGIPLLPTQLMESAFLVVLTVVLVCILRKQKHMGVTTGWYFILYGVWRFIIEFFRSDDRGAVGGLSTSQFIGIFIILAGIALLVLIKRGKLPLHPRPDVSRETSAEEVTAKDENAATDPAASEENAKNAAGEAESGAESIPSEPAAAPEPDETANKD